jgi:hypothetical protein
MGWFFGRKLLSYMIINRKGQLRALKITPGNTGDRAVLDTNTLRASFMLIRDILGKLSSSVFGIKDYNVLQAYERIFYATKR